MSALAADAGARAGPFGSLPLPREPGAGVRATAPWSVGLAVAAALHAVVGFHVLTIEDPVMAPEAPEAALLVDLPPQVDRPPMESVPGGPAAALDAAVPSVERQPVVPAPDPVVPAPDPVVPAPDLPASEPVPEAPSVPPPAADTPPPAVADAPVPEAPVPDAPVPDAAPAEVALAPAPPVVPAPKPTRQRPKALQQERSTPRVAAKERSAPAAATRPARPDKAARPAAPRAAAAAAAVPGRSASGAGRPDPNALGRYLSSVRADIMRQRRGIVGEGRGRTAVVRFTITASGTLGGITLAASSGSGVLDEAALAMVRRASPVPALPSELGASLSTRLPVRFD